MCISPLTVHFPDVSDHKCFIMAKKMIEVRYKYFSILGPSAYKNIREGKEIVTWNDR